MVVSDDYVVGFEIVLVIFVEYFDFECEVCGVFYLIIKEFEVVYLNDFCVVSWYFLFFGYKNSMMVVFVVEVVLC